jgi:hypothetical protein
VQFGAPDIVVNAAVTLTACVIVTLQSDVPLQAPDHPEKRNPLAAVAVNVTAVPLLNFAVQLAPQSMAAGAETTVPLPEVLTVSACCTGATTGRTTGRRTTTALVPLLAAAASWSTVYSMASALLAVITSMINRLADSG